MAPGNRTTYFARILGPFMLAIAAAVATKSRTLEPFAAAFFSDPPLIFVTGAMTMLIGMAILAAHWRWDGIAAIIVTVFGLATAVRGALLLIAPAVVASMTEGAIHVPGIAFLPAAVAAGVGLYLCVVGWTAKASA